MGSDADRPQVAKFAEDLFGEPFDHGDCPAVIGSHRDDPMSYFGEPWGSLSWECWKSLRNAVADGYPTARALQKALSGSVPRELLASLDCQSPATWLSHLLLGDENSRIIVSRIMQADGELFDLTDLSAINELGIKGLPADARGARALSAMVEVLAFAEYSEGVPILASRYHSFFRAPEGLFVRPADMTLMTQRMTESKLEDGSVVPVYEISVCRHCGEAYLLGKQTMTKKCTYLDQRRPDLDKNDNAARSYYRLIHDGDSLDDSEQELWFCPLCGSLHSQKEGGPHRAKHPDCERIRLGWGKATEDRAQCGHCGYQNRYAIQPMRVSPEAAGSVVCYDLVRDIPPFEQKTADDDFDALFGGEEDEHVRAGSVVCFSDRRQDAAYFAPAMLRTYNNITKRQMIRKAVESLCQVEECCQPSDVSRWLAQKLGSTYSLDDDGTTKISRKQQAEAMVLDELMSEDSRNSLEGLGVVRVWPEPLIRLLREHESGFDKLASRAAAGRKPLAWLRGRGRDYVTIMQVCLDTLRERGALKRADGVEAYMGVRARQSPVVLGDGGRAPKGTIRFVGAPGSHMNKRCAFIIGYVKNKYGVDVSREDAEALLGDVYGDLRKILKTLGKRDARTYIYEDNATNGFLLSEDLWSLCPAQEDDALYICDTCGCMTQADTGGVCLTRNCHGHPRRVSEADVSDKDRYYKKTYCEDPLPVRVEEHTAQLSTKRAAVVQRDFIEGKVNVLSCTTTFELGVDVGDLRAVFMRNVPPSPANYAQRAGRVGRRAGKPGFAVTFARLRPHDIEYYRTPSKIIAGATRAPSCYLDNPAIAARHVFALVLSEYFRSNPERGVRVARYDDFMTIEEKVPHQLLDLREFMSQEHETLTRTLQSILPASIAQDKDIDLAEAAWTETLAGEDGRLLKAHAMLHEDWDRLQKSIESDVAQSHYERVSGNAKMQQVLRKRRTIDVLAESGVLPKYGFPTDLVQLRLVEQSNASDDEKLDLSRGLRQAIREYAPGQSVVAGKRIWKSVGIRKTRGKPLESRNFGVCPNPDCHAFLVPIDTGETTVECPLCGSEVKLWNRLLVPENGFVGKLDGEATRKFRRPRNYAFVDIEFAQTWADAAELSWHALPGGRLGVRYAANGRLYAINRGPASLGFSVCPYCGAASPAGGIFAHTDRCQAKKTERYQGIGTSFTTDVLELTFDLKKTVEDEGNPWRSTMWAIYQAAVSLMNVPDGEIGVTTYTNFSDGHEAILVYDDVPGGAGRALQLRPIVGELLQRAFEIVDSCDCGKDTCCYGCLCNYLNQGEQDKLSRGAARKVLGRLLLGEE